MAHFAKVSKDGTVEDIIVIDNEKVNGLEFPESEPIGKEYIKSIGLKGIYVQTSYNSKFRKTYAIIGSKYDADNDVFIPAQPFPSFTLNENFDWEAPSPYPNDGKKYWWDEKNLQWQEV